MHTKVSGSLVETEWLEKNLQDPRLRIIDCHYYISIKENNVSLKSGRSAWDQAHIPNSLYVDLLEELSDPTTNLPFMMPALSHFCDVMSQKGIGNDTTVIIHDREQSPWASRLWLMFQEYGFANAAVLNGGWKKWLDEGRPVTVEPSSFSPATFTARPHHPSFFTDKEEVLRAIHDGHAVLICALDHESFFRGHIPHSLNIDARMFVHPETNAFFSLKDLNDIFKSIGATKADRIITYCGGGIASSCAAFALILAGYENVAVYDGSMEEWARDPDLPIEINKDDSMSDHGVCGPENTKKSIN
jgi:thiosulfate/3-mercaptopyruvate sulfurtransferase